MYDYLRLFIDDKEQIERILNNPLFEFKQGYNRATSELYEFPQTVVWDVWQIVAFSPTWLEIKGSIHKYYNNGTNETDFSFSDAKRAIQQFCTAFNLNPELARITNLEFGVNVRPSLCASELISQIICLKNIRPIRPYEGRKDYYFIEFPIGESYVKVYDKGKQYKAVNTLRFEVKAMTNRYLAFAGIKTLSDLLQPKTMQVLGMKINQVFKNVVFTDDTINLSKLTTSEKKNYLLMKDPNEWAKYKGSKSSTHRNRETRFKEIVNRYGKRQSFTTLSRLIEQKTKELTQQEKRLVYRPKYTPKTHELELLESIKKRVCISCGKDISHQRSNSKFCSPKTVGEKQAHQCRNNNSNPRNNLKRKIESINSKGTLFDITPFLITRWATSSY